jgi:hypothetical protein
MSVVNITTNTSYSTLSAAISASSANDVIQISAGTYIENFPPITHSLTIESVGGLAYLSNPSPTPTNGRAVLDVPGNENVSLTISGLAISGAVDPENNGAGILFETGNANLTVIDSLFDGNQEGILTGGTDTADPGGMHISITDSEFTDNGVASSNPSFGYTHNLYVGAATTLDVTGSYFTDAISGHEIKSLALSNTIENNRILDGATAQTSYSIDFANGGSDVVTGNVIEKGPKSINEYFMHFGDDSGTSYPGSSLVVSGNTLIDDVGGSWILLNETKEANGSEVPATLENNTLYNVTSTNLIQDSGTPPDSTSGNVFLYGQDPTLDTSPPFGTTPPPCFAAGTRIETARGPVAVERLRVGDRVRTDSGDFAAVRWLGHRGVDCCRHPRPEDVWPVRVAAHAFGLGRPHRALLLSPDHAVYCDGVLIPVRYLLNGATVRQERRRSVTYWHVELPRHSVLLAEGLPCESYLDSGNRCAFANGGTVVLAHPDFARAAWAVEGCAPLVTEGPARDLVYRRLLAQARALGWRTVDAEAGAVRWLAPHTGVRRGRAAVRT